ncbi:hypothetical protein [Agrococcus sp. ProA11]|uniref:hypothetical protein n=1 Tax=Agrococcus chionoecetis TaxID=3153752 RepID=UPI0032612238
MATPSIYEVRKFLVEDNGWTEVEFTDLAEAHDRWINDDGTTTATYDEWEYAAATFTTAGAQL